MASVQLEQLAKQYPNGVWAVRDFNLVVNDGELVVLVGPSGCGKTTTLRMIAGLEEPTGGVIRLGDRAVNQLEPHRRDVAMVFQRPALYPHLSVRDNLAFGLRLRQRNALLAQPVAASVERQRVDEAARMLGLEEVLDRRPNQLSGGQQQRVALGRAMVRRPAVFLLDEPLGGLDLPLRAELRRELHLLQRRLSATMICVTHDQTEAMALGDRVVVMNQGTVQQVDCPRALYEHPYNRFVAGFIGWPPMSFLDGELTARDGGVGLAAGDGWLPLPPQPAGDWSPYLRRPLTLGIRPHDVALGSREGLADLEAKVLMVESWGPDLLVTLQRDPWRLTARLAGGALPADGQTVTVSVNMGRIHLFDRSSGIALRPPGPAG